MRDYELCVIRPVTLTDAMLTSSNVAETAGTSDPAAWISAHAYNSGDQVSRIGTNQHAVYQALANVTSSTPPESDSANWAYVGPTNRWKMFDAVNETQTSNANTIQVTLTPGQVADAIGLDNLAGNSVAVSVASGYSKTKSLRTRICRSWYDYWFAPFLYRRAALFADLPPLSGNVITLTVDKTGSTAKAGTCVIGRKKVIGAVKAEAAAGIIDYSKRTTDAYGNTTIVKRAYSKRMTLQVLIDNRQIDDLEQFLADYRATPLYWSIAGKRDAFSFMAFYKSFEIVVAYSNNSLVNLEVEGLT
jgi:hypothetical protein